MDLENDLRHDGESRDCVPLSDKWEGRSQRAGMA
jgi:hypothetical protein